MLEYIFNPTQNKTPSGVCLEGTRVTYKIKVSKFKRVHNVNFVMHRDGECPISYPMTRVYADERYIHYEIDHLYTSSGHYWYHFECITDSETIRLVRGDRLDICHEEVDRDYLELIIESDATAGEDYRRGIIYHIFVDRFCRKGNVCARDGLELVDNWNEPVDYEYDTHGERVNKKCYGGNFEGIISKLDYLKELGVTMLYLSPVFEANSNHKYDVADYSKIDEMFGGEKAFRKLIASANKKGIKIIIDGVFNHTGSDSVYFNKYSRYDTVGAYNSMRSEYFDWYTFEEYPNKYSCWWGVKSLPQTNENSGFAEFIAGKNGILEKYMKMGVYGFRLDVADELTDDFLSKINLAIKGVNREAYIVGEVWENAASKIAYGERKKYFLGNSLDGVTNYPMKNAIIDFVKNGNAAHFESVINMIKAEYPRNVSLNLMNLLGSHDTQRVMTRLMTADNESDICKHIMSEDEWDMGFKLLKIATVLQYTTVGVPTVYYGDEVGLTGGRDPFCREPYPWGNEKTKILEWYKKLGKLRQRPAIYKGDIKILFSDNSVLVYERRSERDRVLVAVNRGEGEHTLTFNDKMYDLLRDREYYGETVLAPNSYYVLSRERECVDRLEERKIKAQNTALSKEITNKTKKSLKPTKTLKTKPTETPKSKSIDKKSENNKTIKSKSTETSKTKSTKTPKSKPTEKKPENNITSKSKSTDKKLEKTN